MLHNYYFLAHPLPHYHQAKVFFGLCSPFYSLKGSLYRFKVPWIAPLGVSGVTESSKPNGYAPYPFLIAISRACEGLPLIFAHCCSNKVQSHEND